ncbi:hypothetical protein BU17DRAFT_9854, partial [Hysterangium stoloniferum]
GGIGSLALKIAKIHPHFRMIVQDRPNVIGMGEEISRALDFEIVCGPDVFFFSKFCKAELPDALSSGRVKFEAHDFFEPQPCLDTSSIFVLR